ncbi:TonB family protein [Brevundimonas lenta]|uniref:Protein TonB n=1 Tax=Brevundimonas lenta TaxID=424796 RepID=A0A7W6NNP3_9CAUL|nr:protein TonB [Brevundimonas lenta]
MTRGLQILKRRGLRNAGIVGGIVAAHLVVFLAISRGAPSPPFIPPLPPFDVVLVRPPVPPPPPPPPEPAKLSPVAGGGAPAAPSRIHVPPPPREPVPPEVPAPRVQAPEPALVVGVAPIASPTSGMGQGGQGTGTGSGTGEGDGPGSGMTPPRFLRGPTVGELRSSHPPQALRAGRSGVAVVNCKIGADTRLNRCRIISESPPGDGFGAAGMSVATTYYRFRPPTRNGVVVEDQGVTVTIEFGRQRTRG